MSSLEFKNRNINLKGPLPTKEMQFLRATVKEGLSTLTEITVDFMSDNSDTALEDILGEMMTIDIELPSGTKRYFSGYCVSTEYVGMFLGLQHFRAELRPWLWFLTRGEENRIYQEKTATDIIKEIFADYGFSSALTDKLNRTADTRTYCVQYGETDFAFVSRLMEEEGIYYFFDYEDGNHKLVLVDGVSGHQDIDGDIDIEFHEADGTFRRDNDHFWDWKDLEQVRSGKITLNDYDFESPRADQKKVNSVAKGKHKYKSYEKYKYAAHVRPPTSSDHFARVHMEAEAISHKKLRGEGNVRAVTVGCKFNLIKHDRNAYNKSYIVSSAVHNLQSNHLIENKEKMKDGLEEAKKNGRSDTLSVPDIWYDMGLEDDNFDAYRNTVEAFVASEQYRAPLVTPWPKITGLQTAIVTGPSGDEIYTDEYGRIKVQFHWDRLGKKDEKTTCWIRCVMPWTGKNWGMISIPRIGNEVAIQFEEGDPDRPICTGMLYNSDNKPPYALPANMTQTGIKTRSSKQGGTDNFNELVFEDKKDSEFVRLQSEKDYTEIIKNNATITIGLEKADPGDLTQTIKNSKTETLQEGDHTFSVDTGKQTIFVKSDHTETIEGKVKQTVTKDVVQTVKDGDYSQTIDSGDSTREVSQGDDTHTVTMGDMTIDVSSGSVAITAGMEICLTVGGNSITIDNSGITISGTMVTMEGTATVDIGSPSTTVAGDGMLTLDGGVTMIN